MSQIIEKVRSFFQDSSHAPKEGKRESASHQPKEDQSKAEEGKSGKACACGDSCTCGPSCSCGSSCSCCSKGQAQDKPIKAQDKPVEARKEELESALEDKSGQGGGCSCGSSCKCGADCSCGSSCSCCSKGQAKDKPIAESRPMEAQSRSEGQAQSKPSAESSAKEDQSRAEGQKSPTPKEGKEADEKQDDEDGDAIGQSKIAKEKCVHCHGTLDSDDQLVCDGCLNAHDPGVPSVKAAGGAALMNEKKDSRNCSACQKKLRPWEDENCLPCLEQQNKKEEIARTKSTAIAYYWQKRERERMKEGGGEAGLVH